MQITKDIKALDIADKILLEFEDNLMADFDNIAHNAGFTYEIIEEFDLVIKSIQAKNILSESLKYIKQTDKTSDWFILTDLGRQVKKAGGHFAYLKLLETNAAATLKRQVIKDQSDELDLKIKYWQVKTKYLPYIFSTIALIGTGISIFISIKALNYKKDPTDLQEVQQKIKELQERVNKQDSLFRLDNHQKKDKQ